MTATAHAIIGAVIAAKIANPLLAVPLAIGSHIVADMIPHWDVGTHDKTKTSQRLFLDAFVDVFVSFIVGYLIFTFLFPQTNLVYGFFMIIVSQSLDWLTAPYYFFGIKAFKPIYNFQKIFDNKMKKPWGIIYQVLFILGVIALGLVA